MNSIWSFGGPKRSLDWVPGSALAATLDSGATHFGSLDSRVSKFAFDVELRWGLAHLDSRQIHPALHVVIAFRWSLLTRDQGWDQQQQLLASD